jgi:hypothetical protein
MDPSRGFENKNNDNNNNIRGELVVKMAWN